MGLSIICEKAGAAKITVSNNESANFFMIFSFLSVLKFIYVFNSAGAAWFQYLCLIWLRPYGNPDTHHQRLRPHCLELPFFIRMTTMIKDMAVASGLPRGDRKS